MSGLAVFANASLFLPPFKESVIATTTTSLYATGLLDELKSRFEERYRNVFLKIVAVGSGEALRRAAQGDADLVLAHAPSLEKMYIENGVLVKGSIFAYNFFVMVGPKEDPASIRGVEPVEAFKKIYESGGAGKSLFVSRGDNSGTHIKEQQLWRAAGSDPKNKQWYLQSGSGMDTTLLIANEKRAYTLSDIGTFLQFKERVNELSILVESGEILLNIYSVYLVNPERFPNVKSGPASRFRDFMLSQEGQRIIDGFGRPRLGSPLFFPAIYPEDIRGILVKSWRSEAGG